MGPLPTGATEDLGFTHNSLTCSCRLSCGWPAGWPRGGPSVRLLPRHEGVSPACSRTLCSQDTRRQRPRLPRSSVAPRSDLRCLMRSCPCFFRCVCDETFAVHFFFSTHTRREDASPERRPQGVRVGAHGRWPGVLLPCAFPPLASPDSAQESAPVPTPWLELD